MSESDSIGFQLKNRISKSRITLYVSESASVGFYVLMHGWNSQVLESDEVKYRISWFECVGFHESDRTIGFPKSDNSGGFVLSLNVCFVSLVLHV